ncbi:MAG: CocE/NonD family hydrolase [Luteolibacter sp.]
MKPLILTALVVALALSLHAKDKSPQVKTEKGVWVTMRDGVKLATDLYFPPDYQPGRKLPVILTRTPYNKNSAAKHGQYFASHGYVFVAQDCRGRYGSEGVWHWMTDDGVDGFDCAQWIIDQAWSDGKIGMMGTSYVGGTQHAMALANAPGLRTIIPVDAVSNCGVQSMRNAGAFELRFWNWTILKAAEGSRASQDPATRAVLQEMVDNRFHYLANLPLRAGTTPLQLAPEYEDWLIGAMQNGKNDAFWAQNNILEQATDYKDIPVYLVGGWYDSWAGNTTANYTALKPHLKGPVYLIMGPWIHDAQNQSRHGQVDFGDAAAIKDDLAWRLEWFDHWLKDKANDVGQVAPFSRLVRLFIMGSGDGHKTKKGQLYHGGVWRDEAEWPLSRQQLTSYHLHGDGSLSTQPAQTPEASTTYTYDPAHPVPTIGGNISSGNDILLQGAWDQKGGPHVWNWQQPLPLSARNDIVIFQTEPLTEDTEITGEIELQLWASSSAVDTDFTAKLVDVYPASPGWPGGFDLKITEGIVRARFRDSLKEEKLMEPGTPYRFTIRLYPTSNLFKKGHRIRLEISSSNFPRFDLNPNTGEPLNQNRRSIPADNTILHNPTHPSALILPVIPRG